MNHTVWNPAAGHDADPRQCPPPPAPALPDGSVHKVLWTPSEGPCRPEMGGAGGEPEGHSIMIRKVVWD